MVEDASEIGPPDMALRVIPDLHMCNMLERGLSISQRDSHYEISISLQLEYLALLHLALP